MSVSARVDAKINGCKVVYSNHLECKKTTGTGTKTYNALYGAYKSSQQHSQEEKSIGVNQVY